MHDLLSRQVGLHSAYYPEWLAVLELIGGSGGVGARVRDPSWVGEGHDSTIKVDDAGRPVKCDP